MLPIIIPFVFLTSPDDSLSKVMKQTDDLIKFNPKVSHLNLNPKIALKNKQSFVNLYAEIQRYDKVLRPLNSLQKFNLKEYGLVSQSIRKAAKTTADTNPALLTESTTNTEPETTTVKIEAVYLQLSDKLLRLGESYILHLNKDGYYRIIIYDVKGKIAFDKTLEYVIKGEVIVDLPNSLKSGNYFIQVNDRYGKIAKAKLTLVE
jgi:hypothetical protein